MTNQLNEVVLIDWTVLRLT